MAGAAVTVGGSVRLVDNAIPGGHVMLLPNAEVALDVRPPNGGAGSFKGQCP